jgi:GAF domain-containing protein
VLKVLASQAAISLENTRLYRDVENREARFRRLAVPSQQMWVNPGFSP